jgi:Tissue inhibitor of metalloproteinase
MTRLVAAAARRRARARRRASRPGRLRLALPLLAALLSAVAVSVTTATPASACSCALFTDRQAFDRAALVLTGTVVSIEPARPPGPTGSSLDEVRVTVAVQRVLKGTLADPGRVRQVLSTVTSSASCGADLTANRHYLVFADAGEHGAYTTSLCSGNREITAGEATAGVPGMPAGTRVTVVRPGTAPAPVTTSVTTVTRSPGLVPVLVQVLIGALAVAVVLAVGAAVLRRRAAAG